MTSRLILVPSLTAEETSFQTASWLLRQNELQRVSWASVRFTRSPPELRLLPVERINFLTTRGAQYDWRIIGCEPEPEAAIDSGTSSHSLSSLSELRSA